MTDNGPIPGLHNIKIAMGAVVAVLVAGALYNEFGNGLGESGGTGGARSVVYRVTGNGTSTASTITIMNASADIQQYTDVSLPWDTSSLPMRDGAFVSVSAQNGEERGRITCTVLVDGEEAESNTSSGGYSICTASGTL